MIVVLHYKSAHDSITKQRWFAFFLRAKAYVISVMRDISEA